MKGTGMPRELWSSWNASLRQTDITIVLSSFALRFSMKMAMLNRLWMLSGTAVKSSLPDKEFIFFAIDLLGRQKRYEDAGQVAEKALADWPDDPDLAFQRASLMDMAGKRNEAMKLMEELLRSNPDNAAVLNYIGYTLAEENRDLPVRSNC